MEPGKAKICFTLCLVYSASLTAAIKKITTVQGLNQNLIDTENYARLALESDLFNEDIRQRCTQVMFDLITDEIEQIVENSRAYQALKIEESDFSLSD